MREDLPAEKKRSETVENDFQRMIEVLVKASIDTTMAITRFSDGSLSNDEIRELLMKLREDLNRGMNYLDIIRIRKPLFGEKHKTEILAGKMRLLQYSEPKEIWK